MTQSQYMMEWWMPSNQNVSKNVSDAINYYIKKYGNPPQILLEVSDKLVEEILLPDGMNIVVQSFRMPKNIIHIGDAHEQTAQMGLEVYTGQE